MDKALTPYVKGGGAQRYEQELRKTYGLDGTIRGNTGGFQQMTQDALTVMNDIPFSIPPYFALLGRAIVTLEGIALTGNPNYGLILEAYPYVARKLLSEDRPEIQKALQEVLYNSKSNTIQTNRFMVLINSALGVVSRSSSNAFIDLDSLPNETISLSQTIQFLLSEKSKSLRKVLLIEIENAFDILLRQIIRKSCNNLKNRLPFSFGFIKPEDLPLPVLIPKEESRRVNIGNGNDIGNGNGNGIGIGTGITSVITTPIKLLESIAPKLSREEELYALSLVDLSKELFGNDIAIILNGDSLNDPMALIRLVLSSLQAQVESPSFDNTINSNVIIKNFVSFIRPQLKSSSNTNSLNTNIQELIQVTQELTKAEQEVLNEVVSYLTQQFTTKTINRLQTLLN